MGREELKKAITKRRNLVFSIQIHTGGSRLGEIRMAGEFVGPRLIELVITKCKHCQADDIVVKHFPHKTSADLFNYPKHINNLVNSSQDFASNLLWTIMQENLSERI